MDPEKTLEIMLDRSLKIVNKDDEDIQYIEAQELAEAVIAMNDWIVNGGFLPELWRK